MKRVIGIFMVLLFLMSLTLSAENTKLGNLSVLKGTVELTRQGKVISISKNCPIFVDDKISLPADSFAKVDFVDKSLLKIQPNSLVFFKKDSIRIKRGNMFLRLVKRGKKFKVYTPTATIGVYGTEFSVMVEKITETVVSLFKGSVGVKALTGAQQAIKLIAGTMTRVDLSGIPSTPQPISKDIKEQWEKFDKLLVKNIKKLNPLFQVVHKMKKKEKEKLVETALDKLEESDINISKKNKEVIQKKVVSYTSKKYGDIDGDGKITPKDYALLYKAIYKKIPLPSHIFIYADVDGNGTLDRKDLEIVNILAKKLGDINRDGRINEMDLEILTQALETKKVNSTMDLDGSGSVDKYDLNLLKKYLSTLSYYIGR